MAKNKIGILSGGEKQLINVARMLVLRPEIAIIDECFSSMNEEMAFKYINIIMHNFKDVIFIVTSHRKSDISVFGCKFIRLKKEKRRSGDYYVTQE